MKTKHAIIIFVFGYLISLIGALFKITHWGYGNLLLSIGSILKTVGGLIFLYKLITYPKMKDFLNS